MNRGFGSLGYSHVGFVDGVPPPFWCRRCRCGRAAACTVVAFTRPFRTGHRYGYACSCGATFWVRDLSAIVFAVFGALVLSGGAVLLVVFPPGSAVGAESSNRMFGFGLMAVAAIAWVLAVAAIRAPFVHPRA